MIPRGKEGFEDQQTGITAPLTDHSTVYWRGKSCAFSGHPSSLAQLVAQLCWSSTAQQFASNPGGVLGEEELLDVVLAKGRAAAGALAVARFQVLADAVRAEDVPALGDNDVLLALMAHIAAQQSAHGFQLLRIPAAAAAPPKPLHLAVCHLPCFGIAHVSNTKTPAIVQWRV